MNFTTYKDDLGYISKLSNTKYCIHKGFVKNMNVEGVYYVNDTLNELVLDELKAYSENKQQHAFLPALKQVANVASLPGIVKYSIGLPDIHSGYGFAIGNVAAFDLNDSNAVISPGGVGFDINCGVRVLRTNLMEADIIDLKQQLAQSLFDHIPVGVGSKGLLNCNINDLENVLQLGIDWSLLKGHAWAEDKEHCEEYGRMLSANATKVSSRAKNRGLPQLGTLGAGNHYAEIQVVSEIYDLASARQMGLNTVGQVCVMIHSGSRGLGHQVATDSLIEIEKTYSKNSFELNDMQLVAAKIHSKEGQNYLQAMAAAANYAWVNRSTMTYFVRQVFAKTFNQSPDDLDMNVIYDVSHNIAKIEEHMINGKIKSLLIHRKGSTRAFPPNHPLIPLKYQSVGQPVLIGGSMGTYSYILTGTNKGLSETFGSTCHGAGRSCSRNKARYMITYEDVLRNLAEKNISICVASPKLIMEEAPEAYKDVCSVVQTCQDAGISNKCVQLRPIAVIKG